MEYLPKHILAVLLFAALGSSAYTAPDLFSQILLWVAAVGAPVAIETWTWLHRRARARAEGRQ